MASETKIGELLERVKSATVPDRELDEAIYNLERQREKQTRILKPGEGWLTSDMEYTPPYTSSIDAALALVERALPGAFYLFGKGRVSAKEPLYACQFLFGADEVLGEAEHDKLPLAILAAALSALSALKPERDGEASR